MFQRIAPTTSSPGGEQVLYPVYAVWSLDDAITAAEVLNSRFSKAHYTFDKVNWQRVDRTTIYMAITADLANVNAALFTDPATGSTLNRIGTNQYRWPAAAAVGDENYQLIAVPAELGDLIPYGSAADIRITAYVGGDQAGDIQQVLFSEDANLSVTIEGVDCNVYRTASALYSTHTSFGQSVRFSQEYPAADSRRYRALVMPDDTADVVGWEIDAGFSFFRMARVAGVIGVNGRDFKVFMDSSPQSISSFRTYALEFGEAPL